MKKNEILKMRLEGMTYQQIGDALHISRQRVQQLISPSPDIRKYVIGRANGKCELCGVLVGKSGHIHHKGNTGNGEDYSNIDNLQLLCLSCHRIEHCTDDVSRGEVKAYSHTCLRCGHKWTNKQESPMRCPNPKCRSPYWDRPRKRRIVTR